MSSEFVAGKEDMIEVYHRAYNERRPVVCLDEVQVKLVDEIRTPRPAAPDVAECELSLLSRQCLNRRIASRKMLQRTIDHWVEERNHRMVR